MINKVQKIQALKDGILLVGFRDGTEKEIRCKTVGP